MVELVGDLVVDLSLDVVRFDEQMVRVRCYFFGMESDVKKIVVVVEQLMNWQVLVVQKVGIFVGQYKVVMCMLFVQFIDVVMQFVGG